MQTRQKLIAPALALLIGLTSGALGYSLGMPLPWMLGSMIGTTACAMVGVPIASPTRMRPFVIPVIGVMLGAAITTEIWAQLASWTLTLAILPVFLLCSASVSFLIYRKIGRYDPITAFHAAMPGGLNEMVIIGGKAGGDENRIALAHAARVLLVIFFVVIYFGLILGVRSGVGTASWVNLTSLSVQDYVVLGLCAVIGVPLANRARLPAATIFGPMILSGAAHLSGLVSVAPPSVIVIAAQVVLGTVIGSRFIGTTVAQLRKDLTLAGLATLAMLCVAVGFAQLITMLVGMPLTQAFLAFSPGGLTEMTLLTLAMGQDVAFVSVAHIARITLVVAIAPSAFSLLLRAPRR